MDLEVNEPNGRKQIVPEDTELLNSRAVTGARASGLPSLCVPC